MNEKEIFNIVDSISEEDLSQIMDKTYLNADMQNSVVNYSEKEKIRAKLHEKLSRDIEFKYIKEKNIIEQNINNQYENVLNLEENKSNVKVKSKNRRWFIKNKFVNGAIASAVAMLVFITLVNVSPSFAKVLAKIPVLNELVEFVALDKGFNNVVNSGKIQDEKITVEGKGVKFTVKSIAGDKLKLWIGYEFEGQGCFMGRIKFKNKVDNKELPWSTFGSGEDNYMEVFMNSLVVKEFIMEFDVYKDNPRFHEKIDIEEINKKTLKDNQELFEKSKVTTLSVPISLSEKIYKNDLTIINLKSKEIKSQIGIFKFEKLELAKSRSIVYGKLVSQEYELVELINPILIDENGRQYWSPKGRTNIGYNNGIRLELQGGVSSIKGLTFKCDGFKYIKNKDKYITIDLRKKIIESNDLGLSLVSIEGSNITLKESKNVVEFKFEGKNEKGENIFIKSIYNDPSERKQVLGFKKLKGEKIILSVHSVMDDVQKGFNIRLLE